LGIANMTDPPTALSFTVYIMHLEMLY
jgi:hypothetical protein